MWRSALPKVVIEHVQHLEPNEIVETFEFLVHQMINHSSIIEHLFERYLICIQCSFKVGKQQDVHYNSVHDANN